MDISSSQPRQETGQPFQDQENRNGLQYCHQYQIPPPTQDHSSPHFRPCNIGRSDQPPEVLAQPEVPLQQAEVGGDAGKATGTVSAPVPSQQELYHAALALNPAAAAFVATWAQISHLTGAIGRAGMESLLATLQVQQWQAIGGTGPSFISGPDTAYHGNQNLFDVVERGVTKGTGYSDQFQQHGGHEKAKSTLPPQTPASQNKNVAINEKKTTRGSECELCKVHITSLEIIEEHENGKKHKKNLKRSQQQSEISDRPVAEILKDKIPDGDSNPNLKGSEPVMDIEKNKKSLQGNLPTVCVGHENPTEKAGKPNSSGNQTHCSKRRRDVGCGGKRMRSVDVRIGLQKPPKPKTSGPFICNLCKVRCNAKEELDDHLGQKNKSKQNPPKTFNCNWCNVKCSAQKVFDDHLSGKKHISKLKHVGAHQAIGLQAVYPPSSAAKYAIHQQHPRTFQTPHDSHPSSGDVHPQSHSSRIELPVLGLQALHPPRSVEQNLLHQQVPIAFFSPHGLFPPSKDVPPPNQSATTASTGTLPNCSRG